MAEVLSSHPCFEIVESGHLAKLKFFVRHNGVSVNLKCENGLSLLHQAVRHDQVQIVRWLIKSGASIYGICKKGRTLLHMAALGNSIKSAEIVLKQLMRDITTTRSSFFSCCQVRRADDDLLADGRSRLLLAEDVDKNTPLHFACQLPEANCAKLFYRYLFRAIPDPCALCDALEQTNNDGHTVLHVAIASRSAECCQLLFEIDKLYEATRKNRGKRKIYATWLKDTVVRMSAWADRSGRTPAFLLGISKCPYAEDESEVHCCRHCQKESLNIVRLLYKHCPRIFSLRDMSSGKTPFMVAAGSGNLSMMQALRDEAKADVEEVDSDGRTALHLAAIKGLDGVVAYLLNVAGALANVLDGDGYTPIHYTTLLERTEAMAILHQANAQLLNVPSSGGYSSLMLAVLNNCLRSLNMVLFLNPSIDRSEVDFHGSTPAIMAARTNHAEALSILLTHNFDITKRTDEGYSLLQVAVHYNSIDALRLIRDVVNLQEVDDEGSTVLHTAASDNRSLPALQFLLSCAPFQGTGINRRDNHRRTALHVAVMNSATDCAKLLINNGSDIWATDDRGFDPFMYALDMDNVVLFTSMIGIGINVNGLSIPEQTTTLSIALGRKNTMIARYLRINGGRTIDEVRVCAAKKIQRWYRAAHQETCEQKKKPLVEGRFKKAGVRRKRSVADLVIIFERLSHNCKQVAVISRGSKDAPQFSLVMRTICLLLLISVLVSSSLADPVDFVANLESRPKYLIKRSKGVGCGYGGGYGGKPHDYGPNAEARHRSPSYGGCSGVAYNNAPFGLGPKQVN
ncbi:hypothetical protein QR680_016017 [Steinernema hermaphroditum]|nr:hypothetical protein QR680_016017 [Steinernema hermaphroditum]